MNRIIEAIRQAHKDYLKSVGSGSSPTQRDVTLCKRRAQENHEKTLEALEKKNLQPAAKQAALKAAAVNLKRELDECTN